MLNDTAPEGGSTDDLMSNYNNDLKNIRLKTEARKCV